MSYKDMLYELAQRLVIHEKWTTYDRREKCYKWPHCPGMRVIYVDELGPDYTRIIDADEGDGLIDPAGSSAIPDLSDDGTAGVLLGKIAELKPPKAIFFKYDQWQIVFDNGERFVGNELGEAAVRALIFALNNFSAKKEEEHFGKILSILLEPNSPDTEGLLLSGACQSKPPTATKTDTYTAWKSGFWAPHVRDTCYRRALVLKWKGEILLNGMDHLIRLTPETWDLSDKDDPMVLAKWHAAVCGGRVICLNGEGYEVEQNDDESI